VKTNKSIIFALVAAFVLGMAMTAGAATIKAVKVKGAIPVDPSSLFWSERYGPTALKHVIIDMDPQMITNPMWPNPQTKYVFVKAATNGKEIAIHLEWTDPTRNDIMVRSQQYKDQAALMFPVNQSGEEPPFTYSNMAMGSGGYYMYEPDGSLKMASALKPGQSGSKDSRGKGGVHDGGVQNIGNRGSMVDFGMGKNEGVYNPGRATHNILSDASMRRSPIEDLNAEGFSTLTTQANQDVDGKGNWSNNRWSVVFKRALTSKDSNDTQFSGGKAPMAIAIWNGGNKERNGQKAVTQWQTLEY